MQVNAISSAYTGAQKQTQGQLSGNRHAGSGTFSEFLKAANRGAAMEMSEEEAEQALERVLARMELLLGKEVAQDVIHEGGSVDIVRYTQVMATDSPYTNGNRAAIANAPQVVDLIA